MEGSRHHYHHRLEWFINPRSQFLISTYHHINSTLWIEFTINVWIFKIHSPFYRPFHFPDHHRIINLSFSQAYPRWNQQLYSPWKPWVVSWENLLSFLILPFFQWQTCCWFEGSVPSHPFTHPRKDLRRALLAAPTDRFSVLQLSGQIFVEDGELHSFEFWSEKKRWLISC